MNSASSSQVDQVLELYKNGAAPHEGTLSDGQLAGIGREFESLIDTIRNASSRTETERGLDALGCFQERLATLCFRFRVELPWRLREFVRVYDRCDDAQVRQQVCSEIKHGVFLAGQ